MAKTVKKVFENIRQDACNGICLTGKFEDSVCRKSVLLLRQKAFPTGRLDIAIRSNHFRISFCVFAFFPF